MHRLAGIQSKSWMSWLHYQASKHSEKEMTDWLSRIFFLSLLKPRNSYFFFAQALAVYLILSESKVRRTFMLWSLRFSWGWKKCILCTKHKPMRCALEQTPRCAAWGDEPRRRGGKGGGNCHIKGKEFKINLISQSLLHPPPPSKRFTVSMLYLVIKQGTHTVRERKSARKGKKVFKMWAKN